MLGTYPDGPVLMNKYKELAKKLTPEQNRLWAIACAELVLPVFEEKYPDDDRPRLAIDAAKNKSPDAANRVASDAWTADAAGDAAYASEATWSVWADSAWAASEAAFAAFADAAHHAAWAASAAEQAGAKTEEILQLGEKIREQV